MDASGHSRQTFSNTHKKNRHPENRPQKKSGRKMSPFRGWMRAVTPVKHSQKHKKNRHPENRPQKKSDVKNESVQGMDAGGTSFHILSNTQRTTAARKTGPQKKSDVKNESVQGMDAGGTSFHILSNTQRTTAARKTGRRWKDKQSARGNTPPPHRPDNGGD